MARDHDLLPPPRDIVEFPLSLGRFSPPCENDGSCGKRRGETFQPEPKRQLRLKRRKRKGSRRKKEGEDKEKGWMCRKMDY